MSRIAAMIICITTMPLVVAQSSIAPSAEIPPREPQTSPAPAPAPQQKIMRVQPTLTEEIENAAAAYRSKHPNVSPRVLILFNRDMEDNDDDSMIKTSKVQGGVTSVAEGQGANPKSSAGIDTGDIALHSTSEGTRTRNRTEGGSAQYERVAPDPNAYSKQELEVLRAAFEVPFLKVPVRIVDRDTAVRLHGLTEETVFSYEDLPETQRAQVAGIKEYADMLITVRVEKGEAIVRKVSGDSVVTVPNIVARVIQLDDASVIASATTADVKISRSNGADIATRVALSLMQNLP